MRLRTRFHKREYAHPAWTVIPILAVVVTGLYLGHRAPTLQTASSRVAENINWRTVSFVLENAVFLLIGLQIRDLVHSVTAQGLSWGDALPPSLAVLAATIIARIVWVLSSTGLLKVMRRESWTWATAIVVSWAGMRGVVTLAAAFLLPDTTPQRSLLKLCAFIVVAGTLLLQGLTLPWLGVWL